MTYDGPAYSWPHSRNSQVIAAEGEQKASHALRDAAEVIQKSPAALQVIISSAIESVLRFDPVASIRTKCVAVLVYAYFH